MNISLLLAANSIAFGGLLFLLAAGFALIFGLMRIPNLTHGSLFMLGAYFGASLIALGLSFWPAAILAAFGVAAFGGLVERLLLRRLPGNELAQVLVTLGLSFMIADACLMWWGGDPISIETPRALRGATFIVGLGFPTYRIAVIVVAVAFAAALWGLLDRTRLGAMIRAGVDDPEMARVVGIRVSRLFTIVFALGAGLAGFAGIVGGPILSVYPGLDQDMLPLALVVVILGGTGSLLGSFGHAGLFGLACYGVAYLLAAGQGHAVAILAALAITMIGTAVFAALSLRATGIGFIMITLALGEILWGLAYRWISITNGDNGISVASRPSPFGFSLASAAAFYYVTLLIFLLAITAVFTFLCSPLGAALRSTSDQAR